MQTVHQLIIKISIKDFAKNVIALVNSVMVGMPKIVLNAYHPQLINICYYLGCVYRLAL